MSEQARILIVDTAADVIQPLTAYFRERGAEVIVAHDAESALQEAARHPDILLLAATLGDTDGLEIFRRLRQNPRLAHLPIMFIADYRDTLRRNQLLAEGADDVIARPFDVELVGLRVRNAIQRARREDVTDTVTELPTGLLLAEKLKELDDRPDWCVLTVRLLHFDAFRDRYDFIAGNEVLRYTAATLNAIAARFAGDEAFVGYASEATYVLLAPRAHCAVISAAIQAELPAGLQQFYTFTEREQGYVMVDDRRGHAEQRPLMQIRLQEGRP
ncbi:MAG: response regulator [Anaerolineae bacterium]|nr:response regulator [Anaerolineae bacterium]